jgi:two-component system chemotaxis response regulator CheY
MDFLDDVVDEFLDETHEQLGFILDDILVLEKEKDLEGINRIFRVFHTVKGNARMLGFEGLGHFTHLAEELLSQIRKGEMDIDQGAVDLMLACVDKIREMLESIRSGSRDAVPTETLCARLEGRLKNRVKEPHPVLVPPPSRPVELIRGDAPLPGVDGTPILVVEDDFTSRQLLCHFLSRYGSCHVAKDGIEAIEAVQLAHDAGQPYRLICMDIQMPRLDGTEATREIRRLEGGLGLADRDQEVRIVITSALSDANMIVKACYECGADYYFTKPLDLTQMTRQLIKMGLKEKPDNQRIISV